MAMWDGRRKQQNGPSDHLHGSALLTRRDETPGGAAWLRGAPSCLRLGIQGAPNLGCAWLSLALCAGACCLLYSPP
eukprot:scaffold10748_cov71-Isochrysis_galbana.AAC.1